MRKPTTKRKPRLSPQLTEAEVGRIAEKLAVALENNSDDVALILLLVNHFERVRQDAGEFESAAFTMKRALFIGTSVADEAQERFESNAMATRGNLLMWPDEKAA